MENESSTVCSSENAISVELELGRTVNYATQQNDVPVIHSLRVRNATDSVLQDVRVSINTEPAFATPMDRTIASIGPGETYNLGTLDLALSHDFLFQLTERVLGNVHVTVTTTEDTVRTGEKVALLAYDEWSGLSGIPEILAAFVLPNHPAIEAILATAASILQQWTGDASLSGYQSKDRNRVAVMSAAVYTALQRSGIHYINPPASFEESGQKIRTPDRILDNKLGTCLDLAVLTAACLEQAGIYPLISFTTGHAFAGVWLEDECFPDCSTDDVLRLRKRVELGEVCVFETTLITSDPAVPFEQAIKEARRLLDDPEAFRCTVDICRSRKSGIRPLPVRSGIVGTSGPAPSLDTVGSGQQAPAIPFLTDAAPDAAGTPAEEAPASRLDRWKRKLLDLTMHNRLLNFRETRKTLPVLCPDLAFLEDALANGEAFRLYPRPTDIDDSQPRNADVHRLRTGDDAFNELLREEFRAHRLRADATDAEVSRRLVEIYREARTSLEENGANTLYLALGFLSWYESPTSTQQRLAPIILIPLDIERRSVQEGFSINQGDDDPMVNVTLLELLEHDFELSIPGMDPIPQDETGINVQGILTAFRKAVKRIDRWEVLEKACIGHFSFTKFLMWRDLEVRTEDLQRSKVVSHLINTPHEQYKADGDFPDPDALDDTHRPSEMFCPVEADSSQLAAVCAAAEGKSFVLHGPPGTGKSQTITNLIAHALANGKSVLFVSEKMAALSVVHRRLVKSGLGAFCLTLHSNKSRKTEVVDQLGQALDGVATNSSESWLREANRLAALRNELNAYVRALHRVQETSESLFQGMSQLIGLRHVAHVPIGWPADRRVDRDTLDRLRDVVSQLEVAASASTHPGVSVWASVSSEEWSPGWRNEIESALEQLRRRCSELHESAQAVSPLLGMGTDGWCERDLRALSSISKTLLDSPSTPAAMMTASDWDGLSTSVTEWIAHGVKRDGLRSQLYPRYTGKLLQLDLDGLHRRLLEAEKSWFLPRAFGRMSVRRSLRRVTQPGQLPDAVGMLHDIETARALRDEDDCLDKASDHARELLGQFWREGEADWNAVAQMRDTTSALRKLAAQVADADIERTSMLRQQWGGLVSEGHEQLSAEGPIGQMLQDYIGKAQVFAGARSTLESILSLDALAAWGDASNPDHLGTIAHHISLWSKHPDELRSWCYWRAVRHQAADLGLQALIDAYEHGGLPSAEIPGAFRRSFYQWWVDQVTDHEPVLRGFFSREFERKIQQFREVDQRYTEMTRSEVQARLAARLPRGGQAANQNSEMGILQRERQKQRRHMPIRQLFQKIPNLLSRLKPCLLMSPMSVAQYLDPAHPPFDLVVFDEASQIPVWDAVGAIARGCEAVIVGDPKQLPPTNFFSRSDDPDTADDDIVEDLESILDDCLAAQLPSMHLRWHYRSRHESLIAFSNYHYYDNRLLTFPSPSQAQGVSLRLVKGVYDKSRSRTNRAEAEAIVAEVMRRLHDPDLSKLSIGIVTFSISQQTLVEDILDEARRTNPEIEVHFDSKSAPNNEPVFVKNLESVQGDERDAIFFSICYGPDAQGRVSMNFGPMNRDGGERRLNVAVTRARREVIVFSSLRAEQIDLSRTRARGAVDLKSFLDYAERGAAALAEQRTADPEAKCESIFELQVCEALRNQGYLVHSQVGCSGYRIDLAIVDPERPGRYLLGIECDGANYHRAKTARDRDRLRDLVLRDLGWRLHRVWSTDWWEKPDAELARIEAAIEDARKIPSQTREEIKIASAPQQQLANLVYASGRQPQETPPSPSSKDFQRYEPCRVTKVLGDLAAFYEPYADDTIRQVVENVVKCEGPISLGLASRRVAAHWGIGKVGSRVAERISQMVSRAKVARTASQGRVFLWRPEVNPDHYRLFRVPGDDDTSRRGAEDLPPEEIANAALHVLEDQVSMPVDDLVSETARVFGFARTGHTVAHSIRLGIEMLLKRGDAIEQDGVIVHRR
ncbi:MAG: DUF3320 domain-containing protein [Armatimonadetes bacterium]|nr:DUF3320 domain-containing protein [Armatimonadota bacterium]